MRKQLFRVISLSLVFLHLWMVCLKDIGSAFADNGGGNPSCSGVFQTSFNKFNGILGAVSSDLFTGKAQLNIPISVPSGKRDIPPQLSINYQSSSGSNILGAGWSLELGSIARSTKRGVPKYDSSDTFLAAGQELVSIGNNEFRNKIEGSFMKYTFNGTSWVITDKSGRKYYFGSTDNSRVVTAKGIYSWSLDRVEDLSGNFLSVTYLKEQNTIYPLTISYTGNKNTGLAPLCQISFSYENRPDPSLSYITGSLVQVLKRLATISVLFNNKLVCKYVFEYTQSPSTTKSLLSKVTEYGADGTTAYPAVTFTYKTNRGSWSADQAKWHLDKPGAFFDLNSDGIADFVDLSKNVYLGSKDGFSPTANWMQIPFAFGQNDTGIRFYDVNADGMPDALQSYAYNTQLVPTSFSLAYTRNSYIFQHNDPKNPQWVNAAQWNLPVGVFHYKTNSPVAPDYNFAEGGVSVGDLNGDGLNDVSIARSAFQHHGVVCGFGGCQDIGINYSEPEIFDTYINTGNGWQKDTRWNSPDGYYATADTDPMGDGGRRLADINGDGLADLLVACNGYKATYLNNGSGWTRNDAYNIPDGDFSDTGNSYGHTVLANQARRLVDINGDVLPDLVIAKDGYRAAYINTGYGWKRDDSFNIPDGDFLDSMSREQGRYLTDLNGDCLVDLYVSYSGYNKVYLNSTGAPDLITGIDNGMGGSTNIEYTASSEYDNYAPGTKLGQLPFVLQVVSKITSNDGQGNLYSKSYSYKGGYYSASDREFRGFGYVKEIDAEGNYKENYFLQDDIYKGKLSKQQVSDSSGNLLAKTENTWQATQPYTGANFPYLTKSDSYVFDYINSQQVFKQTETQYQYDNYGNVTQVISLGDVSINGDEKSQVTEYTYNAEKWIMALPKHIFLLGPQGIKASEKWFYYDNNTLAYAAPTKGLLTREENWLYDPAANVSDTILTGYAYNQYGLPITTIDPLGYKVNTAYDTVCFSYPVSITNELGQTVQTVYYGINEPAKDTVAGYGLVGQVKSVQDSNNQKTYTVYDALGRVVKAIGPNDTESKPGTTYEYYLNLQPTKVIKRVKANYKASPDYISAYQFSDGLGRVIEEKTVTSNT